jgi:hypothetical protein
MATKLTRLTQDGDTTATSGREPYHLQFSRQATSPETFGYTLVYVVQRLFKRLTHLLYIIAWLRLYFAMFHFILGVALVPKYIHEGFDGLVEKHHEFET